MPNNSKFKKLTDVDIKYFEKIYKDKNMRWDDRMSNLVNKFKISERNIRRWAIKLGLKERPTTSGDVISNQYEEAKKRSLDNKSKYHFITWAQNNTPILERFFNNVKKYSEYWDGQLHVIPGRYKNPTSLFPNEGEDFWDDNVVPYLTSSRLNISNKVTIYGDIKIQPTAVNPMSDLQGLSYSTSSIFGSPKIQLQSIPVLYNNDPRIMLTTGACTVKNYTDSKAGKKGEFHHTYGFVIVEIKDDDTVFFRQVTAKDNGDFNDLYYNVSDGVVSRQNTLEAIVYGDLHCGEHDENVLAKTKEKILDKFNVKNVVLHDVFSGKSINPYEEKDPFLRYGKRVNNEDDLDKELNIMYDILSQFKDQDKVLIVRSNHDVFLDRWLKDVDWKKQANLANSKLYMELSLILLKQYSETPINIKGIIPELINNKFPNYITLGLDDSYRIKGFELAMHGHLGINGGKGNAESFRRLNSKNISGHTHSAFRKDGVIVCGTSTKLKLSYNNGPSSWTQGHTIIDTYGKAQSIIFFKGDFTTF